MRYKDSSSKARRRCRRCPSPPGTLGKAVCAGPLTGALGGELSKNTVDKRARALFLPAIRPRLLAGFLRRHDKDQGGLRE